MKVRPPKCGYCNMVLQGGVGTSPGVSALGNCCIGVMNQMNEPYEGMSRLVNMCLELNSNHEQLANE